MADLGIEPALDPRPEAAVAERRAGLQGGPDSVQLPAIDLAAAQGAVGAASGRRRVREGQQHRMRAQQRVRLSRALAW